MQPALFTTLLVTHLFGVGVLFILISIGLVGVVGSARATQVAQVRAALFAAPAASVLAPIADIAIVVSGVWLAVATAGIGIGQGWVVVSIVVVAVLAAVNARAHATLVHPLREAVNAAPDGPLPPDLATRAADRRWHLITWCSTATSFAFLYVMVAQPALWVALLAIALGVIVGGIASVVAAPPRTA